MIPTLLKAHLERKKFLTEVIHDRDLWHALSTALPVTPSDASWALHHPALFDAEFQLIASQQKIKHIFKFIPSDRRRYTASHG